MPRLTHVGIHESANRNAGDTLLFREVRNTIETEVPNTEWKLRQLWEHLDSESLAEINNTDGVIVGGGGLLLRDQAGADTSASGWQWNISRETLDKITVPIAVVAIGYNRFRGQEDFDPAFTAHITRLVDKSAFFGLRNRGSIRALADYLPTELVPKLQLQPCPTTVLSRLDPRRRRRRRRTDDPVLRLNVAFDRPNLRFGPDPKPKLEALSRSIAHAQTSGWSIVVTCHKSADLQILPELDEQKVTYEVEDITDHSPSQILDVYQQSDLCVGLRGHAQMIPFGLGCPILSVVSHDKMGWFLEDIKHPEWGVDIDDPDLADKLSGAIDEVWEHPEHYESEVAHAQADLWKLTTDNMRKIAETFDLTQKDSEQRC